MFSMFGIDKKRTPFWRNSPYAAASPVITVIEFLDWQAMRLIAKFLERYDTILAEIESGRDIAPFFCRKEKRAIAETDIQPVSPLCIARDPFD
jgi:hypothetical protein